MKRVFRPADILIPQGINMSLWSVVACDQFTSEPDYWESVKCMVNNNPSSLRLILPEAYLGHVDEKLEINKINQNMSKYLKSDFLKLYEDTLILVERTLASGLIRHGIVGAIDLEEYDYSINSVSPIRATEGTVEDRLPPRVKVRENALLEMPHIIVFVDDPMNQVFSITKGEKLYDFELMKSGGHIKGYTVLNKNEVCIALDKLSDKDVLKEKYGDSDKAPVVFAVGDGNHSLATAKKCWENIKKSLSSSELENHPARFALVELVNIHEESVVFEPIHKIIFDTRAELFIPSAKSYFSNIEGDEYEITVASEGVEETIGVSGITIGELNAECESFCQRYIAEYGGKIDYIHGDSEAMKLSSQEMCCGILLPKMKKKDLFSSVMNSGPFPKKSFSIGLGPDKRYYLESKKIRY